MLSHAKTMFIFFLFRNTKKIINLGVLKSIFVTYKTFCCWSIQMIVFVVKLHRTVSDSESEDPPSSEVVNCSCTDNCQAISVSKLLHMPLHSKCQFDAPLSMMSWFLEATWQKNLVSFFIFFQPQVYLIHSTESKTPAIWVQVWWTVFWGGNRLAL